MVVFDAHQSTLLRLIAYMRCDRQPKKHSKDKQSEENSAASSRSRREMSILAMKLNKLFIIIVTRVRRKVKLFNLIYSKWISS